MSELSISYLVTCKNEGVQLGGLLNLLSKYRKNSECVILDDYSDDPNTLDILNKCEKDSFFKVVKHHLNKNYGEHKNFGKSQCSKSYVFQIDADEMPSEFLLDNLVDIISSNEDVELFWLPRINDFSGINETYARKWGWTLTDMGNKKIVNWPDLQTRIFKNLNHIHWENRLHERIVGAKIISCLPTEFEFALIHTKTMEKQEETNNRYIRDFTIDENRGIPQK